MTEVLSYAIIRAAADIEDKSYGETPILVTLHGPPAEANSLLLRVALNDVHGI